MGRKIKRQILGASFFIFAFVAATTFTGFGNDEAFASAAWVKANARDRGRMAQNLVDGQSLIGQNADVLRQTLGAPDKNWGRVVQYQIDLGWPIKDPGTYGLQVHFDSQGNVALVKIVD